MAKSEHKILVHGSFDEVFERTRRALAAHFRLTRVDKAQGLLEAETTMTWRSWGEDITVVVRPSGDGCEVVATSKTALFQLIDWGKNRENLRVFFQALDSSTQQPDRP